MQDPQSTMWFDTPTAAADINHSAATLRACLEQAMLVQQVNQMAQSALAVPPPAPVMPPPPSIPTPTASGPGPPLHCLESMPQYTAPTLDHMGPAENLGLMPLACGAPLPPSPPAGPAPGSAELPSLGSAGHTRGHCKPCAFLHTKGCENGPACQFCHLCGPGEKKRRQKEKLEQRRVVHQILSGPIQPGTMGVSIPLSVLLPQ